MTKALIRICPNKACNTPMLKEAGCNKMTCSKCRTLSCYICSAIIKGYDHFDQAPGGFLILPFFSPFDYSRSRS
jgi:TRIAD3 protein (E3 ubiquitin-protein ligase RNF216)